MRTTYRYLIIRYVPDLLRMEPRNIGVIVQSPVAISHRINGRFHMGLDEAPSFSPGQFRQWRDYFRKELYAKRSSEFVPERTTEAYLLYLGSRCRANFQLTRPLVAEFPFDDVTKACDVLYEQLVAPRQVERQVVETPVRAFRENVRSRRLVEKYQGLLRHNAYVDIGGVVHPWMYSYQNGHLVVIDKIEIRSDVRYTQLELGHIRIRLGSVPRNSDVEPVIIMDPPDMVVDDGSGDSRIFRRQYERQTTEIRGSGWRVIDDPDASIEFVSGIEKSLAERQHEATVDQD